MNFEERLEFYKSITEKKLDELLSFPQYRQSRLFEAMSYSLKAGGKRIRPVLTLEFCRVCGGNIEAALPAACAIEMIHTFSLIHDDLPCMDNDDMRRGRPSCHKAFDEATALLAGDALEIYPFEIIADSVNYGVDCKDALKMVKLLSVNAGHMGMIGGQQIDTQFEGENSGAENLLNMYELKTSRLLQTAACFGCISAGADPAVVDNASEYGNKLGLAFQIVDDILDVCGNSEEIGKPAGSDQKNNKETYVSIYGLEKARETAKQLTDEALIILGKFPDSDFLKQLTGGLLKRCK